jgi:hypothetical protein
MDMDTSIVELVDKGFSVDQRIKKAEKELDAIKKILKLRAREEGEKVFVGQKARAVISDSSFASCDPKSLYQYMLDTGREKDFWDLIKVKVDPTRKSIGETAFDTISTTTDLEYHKIQFKKK